MFKKREEGYNISDTGNWNVASDFSRLKIMKHLHLADIYSNIATFGYDDFYGELPNDFSIDYNKIIGFERLLECLITLIDNSHFAVRIDRDTLDKSKKELLRIKNIIPVLYRIQKNQIKKTQQLIIDSKNYEKVLEKVKEIKSEINEPLNKNHLIYTDKEVFDPQKYKKEIFDSATKKG